MYARVSICGTLVSPELCAFPSLPSVSPFVSVNTYLILQFVPRRPASHVRPKFARFSILLLYYKDSSLPSLLRTISISLLLSPVSLSLSLSPSLSLSLSLSLSCPLSHLLGHFIAAFSFFRWRIFPCPLSLSLFLSFFFQKISIVGILLRLINSSRLLRSNSHSRHFK